MIRSIKKKDIPQVKEIYNFYILNSIVNFEEVPISYGEMSNKIKNRISKNLWIVFEKEHQILGYAYASIWKPRSGYLHTAETSVYLKHDESKKRDSNSTLFRINEQVKGIKFPCNNSWNCIT